MVTPQRAARGVILVQGTAGWNASWWKAGSHFVRHLERHGFRILTWPNGKPFRWTTALNGLRGLRRWFGLKYEPRDWIVGGDSFSGFLAIVHARDGYAHANAITHSHGIWPVMLGVCKETPLRALISVCPPGRADMLDAIVAARPHIKHWVLVIDRDFDPWQISGGAGDGHFGVDRDFSFLPPQARPNVILRLKDIGHSGLLEPAGAWHWDDDGLFDQLHHAGEGYARMKEPHYV